MLKKNYRKIEKKNDNDMDANVAQLKRSNNKCYVSAFRYIYRCECQYQLCGQFIQKLMILCERQSIIGKSL